MQYKINSALLYKIWFSNKQNVFLPEKNKERFIEFLNDANENQKIYFIYSSKYLSESALRELGEFCKNYKITPVDFENIINQGDELDREMHRLASEELDLWIEDKGGNPGVASDLLRWSKYVINQYGIYSDFDVTVRPNLLNDVTIDMPILLPICRTGPNNDFMAFAYDQESQDIHTDAKLIINKFQEDLKKRLNNLESSLIKEDCLFPKNPIGDKYTQYAEEFILNKEKSPTIQEFRKYLIELIRQDNPNKEGIESAFFQISVITMAGPGALNRLLPIIKDTLNLDHSYQDIKLLLSETRAMAKTNKNFYIKTSIGDTSWIENGITLIINENNDRKLTQPTIETHEDSSTELTHKSPAEESPKKESNQKTLDKDMYKTIKTCVTIDIAVDGFRAIYNPTKENIYKLFYDIGFMGSMISPSFLSHFIPQTSIANDLMNERYFSAAYHTFQNLAVHKIGAYYFSVNSPTKLYIVVNTMAVLNTAFNIITLYNQYSDTEYAKIAEANRGEALDYIKSNLCYFVGNLLDFCQEE